MLRTYDGNKWYNHPDIQSLESAMKMVLFATDIYLNGKYIGTWFPNNNRIN